eukprot:TRINITY_DN39908_c0_g1_i1.p1 TRINITY_DN39908_c0_g1~~TRINITY_DN39908_c0_g1_i1.p1  ORF type:complete len:328 (-),score=50.43 TRINITY_DN39908_c0_g1_i1:71-1054(-)
MRAVLNGGAPSSSSNSKFSSREHRQNCDEFFMPLALVAPIPPSACGDVSRLELHGRGDSISLSMMLNNIWSDSGALTEAFATLAISAGGLAAAVSGSPGVSMACLPWLPHFWLLDWREEPGLSRGNPDNAIAEATQSSSRARNFANGLCWASLGQALCGMVSLVLDDPLSGLISGGIATLGLQAATPAGFRYLPTYIVLSFCNGTMQGLMAAETLATAGHVTFVSIHGGILGKVAIASFLASPVFMVSGLALAWQLYSEQQRAVRQLAAPNVQAPPTGALPVGPGQNAARRPRQEPDDSRSRSFLPFQGRHFRLEPESEEMEEEAAR